jgi:glycosyltransferase involved in cell wall biosynthesis
VSIVVPARDEANNLTVLAARLRACLGGRWSYELIVVDDWSTDDTAAVLATLSADHPLVALARHTDPGKGNAVVAGFRHARGAVVCMIDADLQYPPEAVPGMVELVRDGSADVVVANRVAYRAGCGRRWLSRLSRLTLQAMHGLDVDAQSGLKVVRACVLAQIPLHPAGWAWDVELLVRARAAGFTIATSEIELGPRLYGRTKIRPVSAGWQILRNAMALRHLARSADGRRPRQRPRDHWTSTRL